MNVLCLLLQAQYPREQALVLHNEGEREGRKIVLDFGNELRFGTVFPSGHSTGSD